MQYCQYVPSVYQFVQYTKDNLGEVKAFLKDAFDGVEDDYIFYWTNGYKCWIKEGDYIIRVDANKSFASLDKDTFEANYRVVKVVV